jgi:2-oxoisovalerate dehydrogenase E2 component (dihydrolipoyl transacylase)
MAETRVTMPQLGESVHEGTISKWLVKPGDKVVEFEPMLEVDTDKVSAEVPAPVTGVLKEIIAKEGETVQAGAEIAVVEVDGDGAAPAKAEEAKPEEAKAEEAKADEAKPEEAEAEEAKPVEAPAGAGDAMPSEEQAEKADAEPQPAPAAPATEEPPSPPRPPEQEGGEHRYSPGVILLAEEEKVDLSQVKGTGLGGRVTKKDVRQFVESRGARPAEAQPAAAAATPAGPAAAQPAAQPGAGDETVPLTRIRKLIAENMVRSKTTIPHAWQTQEVDMSGVVANRATNKGKFQQQEGFSLTYLPYVIGAAIASLREHPEVNATFNETEIIIHRDINLGVSVGFEDTLLVPVIQRADGLSMAGLARAVNDLATRARAKQLKADDLQGGTFTVNNSGTFGTLFSYSVINPGQAGILTMEAIVERPMAVQGMVGIKPMMYLCFSFDHRVLDGLSAARYLTSCRKGLEAIVAETPIY